MFVRTFNSFPSRLSKAPSFYLSRPRVLYQGHLRSSGARFKSNFLSPRTPEGDKYVSPLSYVGFYSHVNRHVEPLYGKEGNPWLGLVLLTGVNVAIFVLWNSVSPEDGVEAFDKHQDFMQKHFIGNLTNLKEGRIWTLITPSFSHQEIGHLGSNMFAMWLFGFNAYRVLNVAPLTGGPGFLALYLVGGIGAQVAQLGFQYLNGQTGPPLTSKEQRAISSYLKSLQGNPLRGPVTIEDLPRSMRERLSTADVSGLGASGSVMAITLASSCMFPWDRVIAFGRQLPLPIAAGIYVFSDAVGLTQTQVGGGIGHAAHLGGALVGLSYIRLIWRGRGPLPISKWIRGANPP